MLGNTWRVTPLLRQIYVYIMLSSDTIKGDPPTLCYKVLLDFYLGCQSPFWIASMHQAIEQVKGIHVYEYITLLSH